MKYSIRTMKTKRSNDTLMKLWNEMERNSFSTCNTNNDTIRERKVDDAIIFRNKY